MKLLCTLSILLTLLLALGCSKDEETKTEGDGGDQASADGGDASGGAGDNQSMEPDGGQEDIGLGVEGGEGGLGGEEGGFGGGAPKKSKQPPIDPNAPAGKRQLWTYGSGQADILKIYVGKPSKILPTAFGQPSSWKKQGNLLIYTYDKMRVKGPQNMQFSKVHFVVKVDPKLGGGKVTQVQLDRASGVRIQPAGGLGGEGFTDPGLGAPGEGFEGGGLEGNPGGGPAGGFPGGPTPR